MKDSVLLSLSKVKQQNLVWGSDLEQGFLFRKRMTPNIKFQDIKF